MYIRSECPGAVAAGVLGSSGVWECGVSGRLEFQLSEPWAHRWSFSLGSDGQLHSGKNRGWPHNTVALEIRYLLLDPCSV